MQKMMGGCPNSWWRQASEEASLLLHCPSSIALSSNSIPLTSWCEEHELPQTWSQLLMGGSVTHEEKCNLSCPLESQLNYNSQQGATDEVHDLKQEASEDSAYSFSHGSSRGNNILNFSNKKADRKHHSLDHSSESNSTGNEGAVKKARVQGSTLSQSSNLKVRKEKVGDRITALHQLVSPFGKTDTASVLLEAFGYIRFLQSQIEALSSPYLARGSGNVRQPDGNLEQKKDLRSRGLCLVPVSCTILQAENNINGADYWAPSIGGGF